MQVRRRWSYPLHGALLCCALMCAAPATGQEPSESEITIDDSPLARQPQTPEEFLEATQLMLRLDRPRLAKLYLDQFLAQNISDEELLTLRNQLGTALFVQLAQIPELQPQAGELLSRLNTLAASRLNDPAFVQALIAELRGTPRERAAAVRQLRFLGPYAVPPLLAAMSNPQDHDLLVTTLIQLGDPVVPVLTAALRSPNETDREVAIEALGRMDQPGVAPQLWFYAFSQDQSVGIRAAAKRALARLLYGSPTAVDRLANIGIARQLRDAARDYLSGRAAFEADPQDALVSIWSYNELGELTESRVKPEAASLFAGERLAYQALQLAPEKPESQTLYLAFLLAHAVVGADWEGAPQGPGTAHDLALRLGPQRAADVLELALSEGNDAAAIAALRVLAQNGSANQLRSYGPESPVLRALNHPGQRVQFAAATAILQWDPQRPFPFASRVVEILGSALSMQAGSASVLIDPNFDRAATMSGYLGQLGFDSEVAITGRDGFRMAAARDNVELAVVHLNTIRWELSETIANLRADARTADMPIAIYGSSSAPRTVQRMILNDPRLVFLPATGGASDLSQRLRPFLASVNSPEMTQEQRRRQALAAAFWLRHIAEGGRTGIFDLSIAQDALADAATDPSVALDVIPAYAAIGRPDVQQRLAEIAQSSAIDATIREAAALQLAFHIQRFGRLIESRTVGELLQTWESSQEPLLKTALASVIGSLQPSDASIGRQLQSYPPVANPLSPTTAP